MEEGSRGGLPLAGARFWIALSVYCSLAGWGLSLLGALTPAGWAVALVLFLAGCVTVCGGWRAFLPSPPRWRSLWRRRFRRPLPLLFLVFSVMAFLRGLCNPGQYYADVNSYRTPRVLHWLAEHHWSWIATNDSRLNARGVGFEWMSAPGLSWTGSDSLLIVLTAIPFCLLPGLIFVAFRNLRVHPRVAWHWAWIAPLAYCIVLQAGTGMTDGFTAFYAVAAIAFLLEARRRGRASFVAYGVLAAAFLTGIKVSHLPLLLPIGLALLPALKLARGRLASAALIAAASVSVSFIPIAALDTVRLGDWTGLSAETRFYQPSNPLAAVALNACLVGAYAAAPPFLPTKRAENIFSLVPSLALKDYLDEHFEESYGLIHRRADEAWCGLGFTVFVCLLPFVGVLLRRWLSGRRVLGGFDWEAAVRWSVWISVLVIFAKSNLFALPRIAAPYYMLLLPTFLVGVEAERLVRRRWWRGVALAAVLFCLPVILLSTQTPPWPLAAAVRALGHKVPERGPLRALYNTYGFNNRIEDFYADVVAHFPSDPVIGLVRGYGGEESFYWRPYGSRRVEHVLPEDTAESLLRRGIRSVIVLDGVDAGAVARRIDADRVGKFVFEDVNSDRPMTVEILRIREKN